MWYSNSAAQKLDRGWLGIDIKHLSIALIKSCLAAMFPSVRFEVVGEPKDLGAAHALKDTDRYQFQWWALSLVHARPLGAKSGGKTGKKGADKGIDGFINFVDDNSNRPKRVLVQVKSGHVKRGDIGELRGTIERENAVIGVFITLEEPTKPMKQEAWEAGFYHSSGWGRDFPRIQILTVEELLHGKQVQMPQQYGTFKEAQRVRVQGPEHPQLDLGRAQSQLGASENCSRLVGHRVSLTHSPSSLSGSTLSPFSCRMTVGRAIILDIPDIVAFSFATRIGLLSLSHSTSIKPASSIISISFLVSCLRWSASRLSSFDPCQEK
jgi:hypothetical protein